VGTDPALISRPDSEVVAKPRRRTYTAEYKQHILEEAEAAAATRGGLGALLRREGLYSSLLADWRRERAKGILEALTPQKRGPKSKRNPLEEENQLRAKRPKTTGRPHGGLDQQAGPTHMKKLTKFREHVSQGR